MQLGALAGLVEGYVEGESGRAEFVCPLCKGRGRAFSNGAVLFCLDCKAKTEAVEQALTPHTNGSLPATFANLEERLQWQQSVMVTMHELIKADPDLDRDQLDEDAATDLVVRGLFELITKTGKCAPPCKLTKEQLTKELTWMAQAALTPESRADTSIVGETARAAVLSNAEYLSRPAIIDRLYYIRCTSLGVGGKHEGKTTLTRTEALAIATGKPIYGRPTMQTPVVYAASDDEYPTTRMQLLKMGWNPGVPLFMVRIKPEGDPDMVLQDLAEFARGHKARFVILDMLFDFVRIADELKYAATRNATARIQSLADAIDGHVKATHHSPKWMPDAATAAKAALGSQGIAARFSPIVLSRQWVEGELYTVESTMTRDPRGLAISKSVVSVGADGWADVTQPFQSWMKWVVYRPKILELFDNLEPGQDVTVSSVVQQLEIPRPEAQNALYRMTLGENAPLQRYKSGRSYRYALSFELAEQKNAQFQDAIRQNHTDVNCRRIGTRLHFTSPDRGWKDEGEDLDEHGIPKGD